MSTLNKANSYNTVASAETIAKTAAALKANGAEVFVVADRDAARLKVLELIPVGAEVFTASSVTLDETGIAKALNESGNYDSVKNKQYAMDQQKQAREIRKLVAAPDYAVGSVHALTEDGRALIASLTGSQLPAYTFGAGTLVWVVGANKIVKDIQAANERLTNHVVDLESARARKAYGLPDGFRSFPGKVFEFNREINPNRIKIVIVQEQLGF